MALSLQEKQDRMKARRGKIDDRIMQLIDTSAGPNACHNWRGTSPLLPGGHAVREVFLLERKRYPRAYVMVCGNDRCCNILHLRQEKLPYRNRRMDPNLSHARRSAAAIRRGQAKRAEKAMKPRLTLDDLFESIRAQKAAKSGHFRTPAISPISGTG